jgi:pseudouridine kinase
MNTRIVCVGAVLVDELFFCYENALLGTSNPATSTKKIGGVVSNITQHLALLENRVDYLTALGNDTDANWLEKELLSKGIQLDSIIRVGEATGKYTSIINPDGSLFSAACADNCAKYIDKTFISGKSELLKMASLIVADTNLDTQTIQWLIDFSNDNQLPLILEPVSVAKATKLLQVQTNGLFMITPNRDELQAINSNKNITDEKLIIDSLLKQGIKYVWLRKGMNGSTLYASNQTIDLPAVSIDVKDSTGAGDAALAGWIYAYLRNEDQLTCLKTGHALAYEILQIQGTIMNDLTPNKLIQIQKKYYSDGN